MNNVGVESVLSTRIGVTPELSHCMVNNSRVSRYGAIKKRIFNPQ